MNIFNYISIKPFTKLLNPDWFLRIPLILVMFQQSMIKFPLTSETASSFGLSVELLALVAITQLLICLGLIIGGLLDYRLGDLITRLSGLAIISVMVGILVFVYWAPIMVLLTTNQYHLMLLSIGIYFLLNGNNLILK